ncbi:RHS repeat-associated core domain-containing protein [Streptomyces desertarenae]|uniref:RHS repeat-associated core domain-containing protein n=1 Tax=Streptomyces desertarenae TaxID=2666184 RepID=A0ABW4PVG2_9ACTN
MGVRLYNPATGRFPAVDPVHGGNPNAYEYVHADPLNRYDLDGKWSWRKTWRSTKRWVKRHRGGSGRTRLWVGDRWGRCGCLCRRGRRSGRHLGEVELEPPGLTAEHLRHRRPKRRRIWWWRRCLRLCGTSLPQEGALPLVHEAVPGHWTPPQDGATPSPEAVVAEVVNLWK